MTGADPAIAIDVHGLTKRFGDRTVVDNVCLRVGKGRIHGFLGPNGSGKTTTIRMLCGLLVPDAGEGTCLGFDIRRDAWAIKQRVGYMTQKFSLYEDLTIKENLDFVARLYALADRPRRVTAALDRLGLSHRKDQLAGTLSGGWKQRLALAACILHEPSLLLLDEPTAGVDPKARREFWDEIHALAADGMTVLVSTHYMDEAERCHRIAYLAYGRLLADGTVEEVVAGSGLSTWHVSGPPDHIAALDRALRGQKGVSMIAPFGNTLHVSGPDAATLNATVARFRDQAGLDWRRGDPTLEDAFIHLMGSVPDNFQAKAPKGGQAA
ncbi:ABC transporter ATP-binding protein [Niveispirillum cyanobacteriorum]|uniref:Multidrug ABC transporter ATP-binding protein n=1 Tax=Niveispirillum cyanobacteriorum TaxID=1612173 RepID=A0A2K9NMA7_9PROT|nr:ABC transporter ATP-binding protein [Niveispirillum cyanobacteriorum]AUN33736.1 multidrug ABC transporter ATP-binding protein [Niveispirillum cyanobacteriorum]GGE82329.1 ABC transporter ATP-binding protein [Niveispirillum cyanobacteriorum]